MRKYHVAVEQFRNSSAFGMFGSPLGFSLVYYTATIADGEPVNAETLYNLINNDNDDKHKTGPVVAWSKIEE